MKITSMTEQECRDFKVPFFDTKEELIEFIDSLDVLNNDYGTAAYAMALAGQASFNYIAHKFGCTGFQASCADLHMIGKIRGYKGPFMITNIEDCLYPQYNVNKKLNDFIQECKPYLRERAEELLKKSDSYTHPDVKAHWEKLANENH